MADVRPVQRQGLIWSGSKSGRSPSILHRLGAIRLPTPALRDDLAQPRSPPTSWSLVADAGDQLRSRKPSKFAKSVFVYDAAQWMSTSSVPQWQTIGVSQHDTRSACSKSQAAAAALSLGCRGFIAGLSAAEPLFAGNRRSCSGEPRSVRVASRAACPGTWPMGRFAAKQSYKLRRHAGDGRRLPGCKQRLGLRQFSLPVRLATGSTRGMALKPRRRSAPCSCVLQLFRRAGGRVPGP